MEITGTSGYPGLLQGPADKADIVAGPASASGLGDQDGGAAHVVLAGIDRGHQLAHHNQGGVAGVVVDVFQSHVHTGSGGNIQGTSRWYPQELKAGSRSSK